MWLFFTVIRYEAQNFNVIRYLGPALYHPVFRVVNRPYA